MENIGQESSSLSFEEKQKKLSELVSQKAYNDPNSDIIPLLFSGSDLENEQLKNYCIKVISNNKNELSAFKGIYKAAKAEASKAKACLNALPFINENGRVNEGLFTEYCKGKLNYIVVKSRGKENSSIYTYKNGAYELASRDDFRGEILSLLPADLRSDRLARAVHNNLLATTDRAFTKGFDELNSNCDIINLKNGLYNTQNGELLPHSSTEYSTLQLNCNYTEGAKCPKWLKYIEDLQTKEEGIIDYDAIKAIQEYMGLVLSNIPVFKQCKSAMVLYSRIGDTGKSVLIDTINNLLGAENIAVKSIQELSERFATSDLYGKRLMVNGDQTGAEIEDSSVFKKITGYDEIFAEKKGKDGFNFRFKGGAIFACNGLPQFRDDKGNHIFKRLLIIPCSNVIAEDKRDPDLRDKLKNELDAIFLWAMEGLKRLKENNWNFTKSEYMLNDMEEYRVDSDTVYAFVKENYIKTQEKSDRVKLTDFYKQYTDWCLNNDRMAASSRTVPKRMESLGFKWKKTLGDRYYLGLKNKDFSVEENIEDDIFK